MRFGVLGPLAVWTADGGPVPVPGLKVRALLAVLLLHEGRSVSADRLIDDLWGDDPPRRNPAGALSAKVSQLRRALEDAEPGARGLVVFQPGGYRLALDDGALDVLRFQRLLAGAAEAGTSAEKAALLADALALWRGRAFADFADEPFAQAAAARLEEQRLTAWEDAAEARLALGEHTALVGELGALLAAHPLRERLRAAHMRALYASGRQSEALASYEESRKLLADELGLDPGTVLTDLHRAVLRQDPSLAAPAPRASNLPAARTELIGRDGAVAELCSLLDAGRLVTLTGPGGVGKTRLGLETAARVMGGFRDGVRLVELAGTGPEAVADTVLAALDVRESEPADPVSLLGPRELLLVLDNCEHVVEAAADLVDELLRGAPGLRVLATSREPLALDGEHVWNVPPLEVPQRDAAPEEVRGSGAVRLFAARAAASSPGFTLDGENAEAVALLCRRLDGIPLALELAATRVRTLGLRGVVSRLDDRFRLLSTGYRGAPPRQRTLLAMIDWSWELLTAPERTVLRRLSASADGWTPEAAEDVCAEPGLDVPELLARLVDRSLVVLSETSEGPRYGLLESVAAYCADKLAEAGETEPIRLRHRAYYLAFVERAELCGPEQRRWLILLDAEAANLRAALEGAPGPERLRLACALAWYWFLRGRLGEARRSLESALAAAEADSPLVVEATAWRNGFVRLLGESVEPVDAPSRAGWFQAFACLGHTDPAGTEELLERLLAGFRRDGDLWGEAAVLMARAKIAHLRSDQDALKADATRSAALFDRIGDRWGRLNATQWLAGLAELTGDLARAARLHRDGLRLAEELGLWPEVAGQLSWLGWLAVLSGDRPQAVEYATEALRLAREQGSDAGVTFARTVLAYASRRDGDLDTAEEHLDALLSRATPAPDGTPPPQRPMLLLESGFVAELRGRPEQALALHLAAFDDAERLAAVRDRTGALEGVACALAAAGRHRDAAAVLGAVSRARKADALPPSPIERDDLERVTSACRAALGETAFAEELERGGRLAPAEAAALSRPQ
ncbi:BTAD domain-containing putative transcriptional regulator [Actinocorallia populi]|uniref:BTAD domain-containing putative transcriptional regulator n=1 Tax=Actinocorallia populi TaxID=2079200 RepID=UPI000D097D1E|nr:BTAD domain-containing putative transcriptional regulator [Actinocorallia populi]